MSIQFVPGNRVRYCSRFYANEPAGEDNSYYATVLKEDHFQVIIKVHNWTNTTVVPKSSDRYESIHKISEEEYCVFVALEAIKR